MMKTGICNLLVLGFCLDLPIAFASPLLGYGHELVHNVPTPRQLSWSSNEFTIFLHFGVNTLAGLDWGSGHEHPKAFNPATLDAGQWVRVIQSAGASGVVLISKHHDGFCLWPSQFTEHSVRNSPWREGKGDIVREVSEECRKAGLRFGVYLSPGDLHEPSYGRDPASYNEYFRNQLRELLTNYGEVSDPGRGAASHRAEARACRLG